MSESSHRYDEEALSVAEWTYPVMFYLSVAFLAILSCVLVLWIYVPVIINDDPSMAAIEAADPSSEIIEAELLFEAAAFRWGNALLVVLVLTWPFFIAERLLDRYLRLKGGLQPSSLWWLSCVLPPLRMCARRRVSDSGDGREQIWFPRAGWKAVDHRLQTELERRFSIPMIFIALLILPVLGVQFYFASSKHNILDYPVLRFLMNFGTGLIWFAFTVEFIVMVSVTEKKFAYCKKHWLDLIIIILPLVSFLRSFSLLRATRLAKLGKLQQLSRLVRVYRLRGVAMRAFRALMILEVIHRLLRTKPEKRIRRLEEQYREKERELELLSEQIERLKLTLPRNDESDSNPGS
ncbi:MAG TPA: hypothetical protein DDW52_12250 [Planctomycetaceae bacterium]|nr:hypothetical protein [Planctomycetaceae bacterium]